MTLIKSFVAPESEMEEVGLKAIKMPRLGRFVALAGKNGAGKSRLLSKLEFYINARSGGLPQAANHEKSIRTYEQLIQSHPEHSDISTWKSQRESAANQLALIFSRVITDKEEPAFKSMRFVPKILELKDPRQYNIGSTVGKFNQAKTPGHSDLAEVALFYIQQLQNRWWNASHQEFKGSQEDKELLITEYQKFRDMTGRMIGATLARNVDGEPTLFGRPIPEAGLSDGQKVILQLCVALHAQGSALENTVFLLDEPENHLHPSAVIDVIKILYESTKASQIWIATHSVPLLAYIASEDAMAIWYVNDGTVTNSGRHPEIVLNSLLGGAERIGQLNSFTGLPAQLAALNYAVDSLLPPKVLRDGSGDDQVNQIQSILTGLKQHDPIKVLDYGAGKGRLLQGILAAFDESKSATIDLIDYSAFDIFTDDKKICENLIKENYGTDQNRYFNSVEDFFTHQDEKNVDIIVMCNVLHEIDPTRWLDLFSVESIIHRSLKDNGYLLIVEDQRIPIGEKAHSYGFLVLDTSHLKTLFGVTMEDVAANRFSWDSRRNDGRLKAHLVSKQLLGRVTSDSRKLAIQHLRQTSEQEIRKLRSEDASYANGQLNGFWTQQFTNASLYLRDA